MLMAKNLYALLLFFIVVLSLDPVLHSQLREEISIEPSLTFETPRLMQQGETPNIETQQGSNFGDQSLQFGTFQKQIEDALRDRSTNAQKSNQTSTQQAGTTSPSTTTPSTTASSTTTPATNQNPVEPKKEQPKILLFDVQKPILGKGLKINQGISYQRIQVKQLQKKFLFFYFNLAEKDKWQKVNITIAMQGSQTALIQCQYDGHDSCFIPNNRLKKDITLFIAIQCQDECTYNLNSHWSDLQHLTPGSDYLFSFGKETFQLYHVELDNLNFQQFRVHVSPRTTRRPFDNVKIYGKFDSNSPISSKDFDFQSVSLWEDGEGLFLTPKDLKSKNFDLLLIGQPQTTYRIVCELITQPNHEITDGEHVYQYLDAGQSKTYHITQFNTQRFEQFSLRISLLSGNLQVQYFYDKQLTKRLPFQPYKYMDDTEYIFESTQIMQLATAGVYLKITSRGRDGQQARDTTFTIKFNGRSKSSAIELNQHVYGFVPIKDTRFAYFNFKRWLLETEEKTSLKFTVSALQVLGLVKFQFMTCKGSLTNCIDTKYKQFTTEIKYTEHSDISQKLRYQFEISPTELSKINNLEEQGTIVVRMTVDPQQNKNNTIGFSLVALEFINNNKVLILREGRPLQQKLAANEMKVYKYINSDENVKQIRIHINEISGIVKLGGVSKDPFSQRVIAVQPEGSTMHFVTNLTWPILVTVRADSKAIFGINMQIILKNDQHGVADIRAIGEDLAYTIRINPNSYSIFQVTPIFYQFSFSYESSQSIIACPINVNTQTCIDLSKDTTFPKLSTKGDITAAPLSDQRKARIKITNPFSDSVAEVTVIFHSRTFDHCDQKKIGKVYSETVKNGTCYSYLLQDQQKTGLQLYISKRQLANMTYSVLICGNSIQHAYKLKTLVLSPQVIRYKCENSVQTKQITVLWAVNTNNVGINDFSVKVDFVVQKTGGIVSLPQGLSYNVLTKARTGILKVFGFSLLNKIDTRIYIHQTIGKFRGYVKIVREEERETDTVSEINYHLNTVTTMDYSGEPVMYVAKKNIEDSHCQQCFLLIAVYTDSDPGRTVEFQVQVVQKYQNLNDDSSVNGYLQAGSFAYYTYNVKYAQATTLLFFLSNQHQRCAHMYLSLTENPGPKQHIAKVLEANELIYNHEGPYTKYFLAVEATSTCEYALSVLQVDSSIHRLQRGKQNMLKLLKGQVRYFTFEQYTDQPFKLISLSKFGDVRFHLNVSHILPNKKTFTTEELNIEKFEVKGDNPNALALSAKDKNYCTSCDYFVAVQALSTTFSTLYLVYPETVVPLLKNKFFSDYFINKGEATITSYNSLERSKLQFYIHSGSLEITVTYKDFKSIQTFGSKSDAQSMIIDISSDIINANSLPPKPLNGQNTDPYFKSMSDGKPIYKERIAVNILLKALSDKTSYTMQVKSAPTKGDFKGFAEYEQIRTGQPNHIMIDSTKVVCIKGNQRDDKQEIMISTNSDNQQNLRDLIFNAKIRVNQTAKVQKTVLKNMISLRLIDPKPENKPNYGVNQYEICMKLDLGSNEPSKQQNKQTQNEKQQIVKKSQDTNTTEFDDQQVTFKIVVTQINSVNILPSDTESIVKGNSSFAIYSDGQFMLDIFECKGDAKVSYSDSLNKLPATKSKMLEAVGISEQRHAVKVSQSDLTFVNVTSQHSVIRWLPINYETDQGTGYLKFEAGDLHYGSKFKKMSIQFQPLQQTKKIKSKVVSINYVIYISDSKEELQYAAQCAPELTGSKDQKVLEIKLENIPFRENQQKQKSYDSYSFDKSFLEERFHDSENIYFTIIANLVLGVSPKAQKENRFKTSISDEHQHYRFIYSRQQMPIQVYKPNSIETISYGYLALIVGSILLILVVFTYLFTRKIVPWIARLRNSHLVEEQEHQENKDDLEVVPPSSDRNQRVADLAVETEEKMKS